MRSRYNCSWLAVVFLAITIPNQLPAQTTTSGGLTGVITDPSGAVVPNADVEIRDNSKGTTLATKTDQEGVCRFFFLAPGKYKLTVNCDGFRDASQIVNVRLGPAGTVNISLEVMKASTSLSVRVESPMLIGENGMPRPQKITHRFLRSKPTEVKVRNLVA